MRMHRVLYAAALGGAVSVLCGCPNPNTYGTPRTLEPGKLQVQASLEGLAGSAGPVSFATPTPPTVGIRYGVADGFDFGARLSNLSGLGLDGKIRLLKGNVDLAIDPGLQLFYYSFTASGENATTSTDSAFISYLHLPLLVGINFSESATLLLTPGIYGALASASVSTSSGASSEGAVVSGTGFGGRFGVGFNFRTSKSFSLQPEVTAMHEFNSESTWLYIFGFGLNFGSQPDYSDLAGGGSTPAPEPPPAKQ
jgi:hypothetical protein